MNFQQSKSPLGIKQSLVLCARILYNNYHDQHHFTRHRKKQTFEY